MAARRSPESLRRAQILDAAAELFGTVGVRASLEQLADASGIQPGSLYHHFESKEAIFTALVARYRADLDSLAERAVSDPARVKSSPLERIVEFAEAIARCGVRHRAALLLSVYEPRGVSTSELARGATTTIQEAMVELLRIARSHDLIRPGLDDVLIASRMCQSMLHVGVGVYHRSRGARLVPRIKCQILLSGIARATVSDEVLDSSAAMRAASCAVEAWVTDDASDTAGRIRAAARAEFARRGYESCTIRDIAAAADLSPAGMYRHVASKDELFWSILDRYDRQVSAAWESVVTATATPLEKLDALIWLSINAVACFAAERRMHLIGLRYAPPTSPNLTLDFQSQLRQVKRILAEGGSRGDLAMDGPSLDTWSRCVIALLSTPDDIVRPTGRRGAQTLGREMVLRGVANKD